MNSHYQSGGVPRNARTRGSWLPPSIAGLRRKEAMRLRAAGQITDGAQAFFNYVLEYATADGLCSHGLATICARLAKGERMVRYYIGALVKAGLIRVSKAAGRYGTRIFEVVIPAQAAEPIAPAETARHVVEPRAERPRFWSQRHGERDKPQTEPTAHKPAPPETFVRRDDVIYPALFARLARFSNRLLDRNAAGMNFSPAWISAERAALAGG